MQLPTIEQIDLLKNKTMYFRGYISKTDPVELGTSSLLGITNLFGILEGERWFIVSDDDETGLLGDGIFQNTSFPWNVKIYQNGEWVDDTYEPSHFDLWCDIENGFEMVYWANFYWNVMSRVPTSYFTDLQAKVDSLTANIGVNLLSLDPDDFQLTTTSSPVLVTIDEYWTITFTRAGDYVDVELINIDTIEHNISFSRTQTWGSGSSEVNNVHQIIASNSSFQIDNNIGYGDVGTSEADVFYDWTTKIYYVIRIFAYTNNGINYVGVRLEHRV